MPVDIIVRPTLGSYTARAKGLKGTASRSEGHARQLNRCSENWNLVLASFKNSPLLTCRIAISAFTL